MLSEITYAGNKSSDYGIVVERYPSLNRPARKYERVSVPGRNGDIIFKEDAWNNYTQEYEVWSGSRNASAPDSWTNIFKWLYPEERGTTVEDVLKLEVNGYHQLIDTYEPNTIRLAQFNEETEVENSWNNYGKSIIRFDCRPERFTSDAFDWINLNNETPVAESKEPYFLKASPEADIEVDEIVGGSVGWNQLCNSSSVTVQSGHKYYLRKGGAESVATSTGTAITGLTSGTDMVVDLTLAFGSTIADYANSTGGVTWLKTHFPKMFGQYNAYDAGSIKSVEGVSAHKMVGFNQWDEEWEVGGINASTGNNEAFNSRIRSKNYIPLIQGATYSFNYIGKNISTTGLVVVFYDSNKNYVNGGWRGNAFSPFTVESGVSYMRFCTGDAYGNTYKNDICINLSSDRNGQYEPYKSWSYPLDSLLTLRGIPKLTNGSLYFDGDTYASDGTVTRKYGIVDLGTLDWNKGGSAWYTSGIQSTSKKYANNETASVIMSRFPYVPKSNNADSGVAGSYELIINSNGTLSYRYPMDAYADAASFKTAMSGVYLVYELATPTTETATSFINPQTVGSTEEYVSSGIVPIGHNSKYYDNPLVNPSPRNARPCLKVYGSGAGTVVCNGYVINISSIPQYIYIDSDSQNCFKEISDANLNNLVTLTNGFPVLSAGGNSISWSGGVTNVEVMPRWWNL